MESMINFEYAPTSYVSVARHLKSVFQKDTPIITAPEYLSIFVQEGKVVGTATNAMNGKAKLNKSTLKKLKTSLFKKDVNVEVYYGRTDGYVYPIKISKALDMKRGPAKAIRMYFQAYTYICDPQKWYDSLVKHGIVKPDQYGIIMRDDYIQEIITRYTLQRLPFVIDEIYKGGGDFKLVFEKKDKYTLQEKRVQDLLKKCLDFDLEKYGISFTMNMVPAY